MDNFKNKILSINQLQFHYSKSSSLFNLSIKELSALPKEKIAITGPSGCGKTTLLNCIRGLQIPQNGNININGHIINKLNNKKRHLLRRHHLANIFQENDLIPYLTINDNIFLPKLLGQKLTNNINSYQDILKKLNIESLQNKYPNTVSSGEAKRTAIARILMQNPWLILADEPTANLDDKNKHIIMQLLVNMTNQTQAALVITTHDKEIYHYFDRIIELNNL